MSRLEIRTPHNQTAFEPGQAIDVELEWQLEARPEAIEARLIWYTQGKGTQDFQVVERITFDSAAQFDTRVWTVRLPDSPYSFSGKLISLIWALELIVLSTDESRRVDIVVAPRGTEVRLEPAPSTP